MGSKIFLYLGIALVLLISSEVAARDPLTDEKKGVDANHNGVDDAKYPGYNGGRDHGNYPGRGGGRGRDYPPRGPRCYHGCCRRSYNGSECLRCCSYAGEAVDAQAETKPHN